MSEEHSYPGLKEFNCKNKHHVLWLKKLTGCIDNMSGIDPTSEKSRQVSMQLGTILANNPMGVEMKPAQFIDIHAGLSIKYAGNVLFGEAYIPKHHGA